MDQSTIMSFLPLVLIFAVMYFLIIRPQNKKAKQHQEMLQGLSKGDKVIMNGGVIGVVKGLSDSEITLEVSPGVSIQVARAMVAVKGDLASAAASNQKKEPAKTQKKLTKK